MKNILTYICMLVLVSGMNLAHAQEQAAPELDSASRKQERSMSEKEAAFKQFYKKDPACDSFRDDNMMDRCRHAYMTAKQEFEKIWAERNKKK